MVTPTSSNASPVITRMSIDTTASVRSITESVLSLYGHESLYETPSEAQGVVLWSRSMQVDQARVSRIVEDHIRKIAAVDEDGPASPLILPYTFKHCPEPRTAINGEAVGALNHLVATELGIPTDFSEDSSDRHQCVAERDGSFFFLKSTSDVPGVELNFLVLSSVVRYYENGKDWMHYELCIILAHQLPLLQVDERRMMILDSLVRQLPLHNVFTLRRLVVPVPWEFVNFMLDAVRYTSPINRQHCYREALAAMLQTVNASYVARSCELCLSGQSKASISLFDIDQKPLKPLRKDQKPLAIYQKWGREGHMTFSVIRVENIART